MQFTVFRKKGMGHFRPSRLENRIDIVVERSQVKTVHDRLMGAYPELKGGRHYGYNFSTSTITFECEVSGNHDIIGKILNDLVPWDMESVF